MFSIGENGPYEQAGDAGQTGRIVSLLYQPEAMHFRTISVLTNTPPRRAQSQPGGMQGIMLMEPVVAKAARKLGLDQVAIRKHQRAGRQGAVRPGRIRAASAVTRRARSSSRRSITAPRCSTGTRARRQSGKRNGSKVRGVGVAMSTFVAGSTGFDGLFVIKPDGKMYIQSGVGNLGTESYSDTNRVAAEMMGMPWEKCDVTWGDTSKNLPWSCVSGGSQTTHAMTRAAHAAASDAIKKAQEIAAKIARREARRLRGRRRTRVEQGRRRRHDAGAGRAEGDRARRHV